ncbi:folylpolyglutamate synthase, mitochondrial isoform X2 [Toxorhynchites rutilus septentrionalis]|uniref:folylpolyglutamate synthase, mitochondrial isoform X2 n=1 Tax=Toxorhynchites rutilus septentrionalis TaxID=329112 RepID=UPI00247AEEEB|nr:folylpolyglutamate synthase, mitochondrial isoform X2 [Toxorhynchites rutilus septentrionalis]
MLFRNRQLELIGLALRCTCKMVLETSTRAAATSAVAFTNAVKALNSLQSNYSVLRNRIRSDTFHIEETVKFLQRIGIGLEKLDTLPVIHISGTKGKGSTCCLVDSILRTHGYKTGFFSSPHLVSVTERIRLNGKPIEPSIFSAYFWSVYNKLLSQRDHAHDLPSYFNFLTILAFDIFLRENVDVAIVEVGIGGRYDCTNVVRGTKTVGITSLGLEHTRLLGSRIEDIAWQKAGIIKPQSNVFTVRQPDGCLDVIEAECERLEAELHVVPDFDSYRWQRKPNLSGNNLALKLNTSLAIQIALNWIGHTRGREKNHILSELVTKGVESCFWPGRCHQIRKGNKRIFLDGAHTVESIEICAKWFQSCQRKKNPKILIFNATGDRDNNKLLKLLAKHVHFDKVFFSPNLASNKITNVDSINLNFPNDEQMKRCVENHQLWGDIMRQQNTPGSKAHVHTALESVFEQIDNNYSEQQECDILVTGSLHLIGAVLTALKMESQVTSLG